MDFKKNMNETDEEYVFRICSQKSKIGSWGDIAELLNSELNQKKCDDAYRKQYSRMKTNYSNADSYTHIADDFVKTPAVLEDEYTINKNKISSDKVEINRFIRQHSRFELFYENIRDAIQVLPPPEITPLPYCSSMNEYVLTIADMHYGSTFESENNVYNREIAEYRMRELISAVIGYVKENNITRLSVVNLGDDIQGILRLSDLKLNDCDVVECVVEAARLWAAFLNSISEYTYVDYYAVSSSNHSQTRNLGSKASELAGEDVEKIINAYINDVLVNNERVSVNFDSKKDYVSFKVFDFNVVAMHGHQIKNIETAVKDISSVHQKFYDYMLLGHYHSAREITVGERGMHNVEVLISPSIIGSCPYADKIMKGSKSSAKIYEFDKEYGHVSSKTFILN